MTIQAAAQTSVRPGGEQGLVALVPRISIHAYCDMSQTAEAVRLAGTDRRMARTSTQVQLGGIPAAIQAFQTQASPNLLIVESHGGREAILAELGMLAEVCRAETRVIVIGHVNDVILYRELIRQGVSEYMVAPVHQLQLIETIASLYQDPQSAPLGRVFAFIGAKGGVGSSTIAHNFAWDMSRRYDTPTVLADMDLGFGTAGLDFNQDTGAGIFDALTQPDRIDGLLIERLLIKLSDKLSLFSGPSVLDRDVLVEANAMEVILAAMRSIAPCIVVDLPNIWSPWVKLALLQADQLVITTSPDLASLRNTKSLLDMLKAQRPNDQPPKLLLNQVGVPKRPEIPLADFRKAIEMDVTATIPYDIQNFGDALNKGQMLLEVSPKSKPADVIRTLTDQLSGKEKPTGKPVASSSLLAKLASLRKK